MTTAIISETLDKGMSTMREAGDLMTRAAKEITHLRSLLKQAQYWIPTEDQCCDEDRDEVRRLQQEIAEAL